MSLNRTSRHLQTSALLRRSRGFSMIELLSVASIAITAVGASVGSARTLMLTQRMEGIATEVENSVQLARSHAISQGQTVYLSIQQQAGAACVLTHTGARDACTCQANGAATCQGDAELLHQSRLDTSTGVRVQTNAPAMAFSALRGMVTPTATIRLIDTQGRALHQIVNVMGRTRTCSPKPAMAGYKAC